MLQGARRVVTGTREDGKDVVIMDGPTPNVFQPEGRPGVVVSNLWVTNSAPADLNDTSDPVEGKVALHPPPNGAVFRIVEFPPEKDWIDGIDRDAAKKSFASFGAEEAADKDDNPPHPLMHKTITIDYGLVLSGECYLVMDEDEVLVKEGDTIIQRGTNHAWSNRSDKPCKIAFILIDGTFD